MQKQIALTGIRHAARLTIYNYYEPLNRLMTLHKDYTCLLMVADYHALKTDSNVGVDIEEHVRNVVLDVLAAGFDVDKGVCFRQSQIPQFAEFASILINLVQVNQLLDPEEANQNSYGFLGYSILQAAEILMFRPTCVPIGSNQECWILLTQDLANQFNGRFGKVFPEPLPSYGKTGDQGQPCSLGEEFEDKRSELLKEKGLVGDILNVGCSVAQIQGQRTLELVKEAIGFGYAELLA